MTRRALLAGSFDPVTLGHLDIIRRAAALFDEVYAVIFLNSAKQTMFTAEERLELLRLACADIPNVITGRSEALVPDYAAAHGVNTLIRGVRGMNDFDGEYQLAQIMRTYTPSLETLFFPSRPDLSHVSSTAARECLRYGKDLRLFLPEAVAVRVEEMRRQ